jgi:tetratricopeptide (TPR) repeat protein
LTAALSAVRMQTATALLYTEGSMKSAEFGRYAISAPLTPAPPTVGLSGRYEVRSRTAALMITEVVANRPVHEDSAALDVARRWYLVTVAYCLRWKLDCADALVAAAERDFPDDAEILLLIGSVAEARGRWAAAATSLQRALAADPTLVEAQLRLARVNWQRGRVSASNDLLETLADARASANVVVEYFTLRALEDVNTRAGRPDRARARRAEATALQPFQNRPDLASLDAWALYGYAQFHLVSERLAGLRRTVRGWAAGQRP